MGEQSKMSITPKKMIFLLVGAVLVLGAAYMGYNWYKESESNQNRVELTLYGNVDIREADLAFRGSDRIESLLVDSGDRVKKGQVLGELNKTEILLNIKQIQAKIEAQGEVVRKLEKGSREEEIGQYEARVLAAEAEAIKAQADYGRMKEAYDISGGEAISKQALANAEALAAVTQAKVKEAQEALNLAVAGNRQEDIAAAMAERKVLVEQLAYQEYLLEQATLKSPADGVIRSRLLEVGEMASPQKTVFKLALDDKKWIRVYIKETDLGYVREGQKAEVMIDSYPGKMIQGQVGYISSTAEFTPKTVQTDELRTSLVYEVRVYVDDIDNVLRMGMPATVTVKLK